jgi:ABC-type branched-subunit amino acid transport system substrate-binding protein
MRERLAFSWTAAGVLAVMAMLVASCGHSDPPAAQGGGSSGGGAASTASEAPPPGTFGTVANVCGPGTPGPSTARGVTPTEIQIGVQNDATAPLQPGLGKAFLIIGQAFAEWCNAAGGIHGRMIKIANRDGKILDAPKAVIDACQTDFMLVGGGTPFDAATVEPRESCGLGTIPVYTASKVATNGTLQAVIGRPPTDEANIMLFRRLQDTYGQAFKKTGIMTIDTPSLLDPKLALQKAVPLAGGTVTSFQKLPVIQSVDARPYVQPLVGKVDALVPYEGDTVALFQTMKDIGYKPQVVIDPIGGLYIDETIRAIKASGVEVPYYLVSGGFPFDLADQNPTLKFAMELTEARHVDDIDVDALIIGPFAAWLLWAQSAMACGDDLTVACVMGKATAEKSFTAGGMTSPIDLSNPTSVGPCRVIVSADKDGFHYERDLTQPTDGDGVYNCDPANVVNVGS